MSSRELYRLYEESFLQDDIGVDAWEVLEDDERERWNRMAAQLRLVEQP